MNGEIIDSFKGNYGFLSNFYAITIRYKGKNWPSVEHAYQAEKFSDPKIREQIFKAYTPGKTKKIARIYSTQINPYWHQIKFGVMYRLLTIKFKDKSLRKQLLATEGSELIEKNHWNDICWGVCNGKGDNYLGKFLMQVRTDIIKRKNNQVFYKSIIPDK